MSAGAGPVLEVLDPGLLLTIQDGGRPGRAREGVTRGGAADRHSLVVANSLVGNPPDAAALEATLLGPVIRAIRPVTIGLAGTMAARVGGSGTGAPVELGATLGLGAGQTLELRPATGARGYLALPGGIDVPLVLGSRSTALDGGFGGLDGRALRAGDVLSIGGDPVVPRADWPGPPSPPPVTVDQPVRVLPGPQAVGAGRETLDALVATRWTVGPTSDRAGIRLDGPPLAGPPTSELASHGVVAGTVQMPPDRKPIVLLADHQPTGGYPVVAIVISADVPRLGQLAPGATVWFAAMTPTEARAALEATRLAIEAARAQLGDALRWDELWGSARG
jgi:biotin-dependent carboxylase-like uncharacterized protein